MHSSLISVIERKIEIKGNQYDSGVLSLSYQLISHLSVFKSTISNLHYRTTLRAIDPFRSFSISTFGV